MSLDAAAPGGPLAGLRVLEFEAIGPAPFAGMMLADMGADVLLVDRARAADSGFNPERRFDTLLRGRRSVTLDLKSPRGAEAALLLADKADVLIEGFRPGVMERHGLGPAVVHARNPRLVFGRITGYGQSGPIAGDASHDINAIARSGVLHAIGRAGEAPVLPLNYIADFGGGGMLLAFGIACAVIEARTSGRGQVVDAAMVEGASLLGTMFAGLLASNDWREVRGGNALDSGAPWYDSYATSDGHHMAVGAIEARFYAELMTRLGLDDIDLATQHDRATWPTLRTRMATAFASRTRTAWCTVFEGSDACVSPVLSFSEARADAQALARDAYVTLGGVPQPAPAPRFDRTPGIAKQAPPERGGMGASALHDWGFDAQAIERLASWGLGFTR